MPHRGRMLLGFAVVPFAAVLISVAAYDLFWHAGLMPEGAPLHSVDAAMALGVGLLIIAVPMTLIGTVPGVLWLHRTGSLTFGRLIALGAALGSLPFALIVIAVIFVQMVSGTPATSIGGYWYGVSGFIVRAVMGLIAGAGSAAVFWLVAVCEAP